MEQGPVLTLSFNTADGLNAGQTQIKYKAVALGTVEGIDLSGDNSHVIVRIRMNNVGRRFLTNHARFWVEGAQLSLTDPSSLGSFRLRRLYRGGSRYARRPFSEPFHRA